MGYTLAKNPLQILVYGLFICLLLSGCGVKKKYSETRSTNTISSYEAFLVAHPKSKYAEDAQRQLTELRELEALANANEFQSIEMYEQFKKDFPQSDKLGEVEERLKVLYERRDWKYAKSINQIPTYEKFIIDYPLSDLVEEAKDEIDRIKEANAWAQAKSSDTKESFKAFVQEYPASERVEEAHARIKRLQELADWQKATSLHTVNSYTQFIEIHSESDEATVAKQRINEIKDAEAYKHASNLGTVEGLKTYVAEYSTGRFVPEARAAIQNIEVFQPAWQTAQELDNEEGYERFLRDHPAAPQVDKAARAIADIKAARIAEEKAEAERIAKEEEERIARAAAHEAAKAEAKARAESESWTRAMRRGRLSDYKSYIQTYPEGEHIKEAEEKIIDLEVDAIFNSDHGQLPAMNRSTYGTSRSTTTSISIQNDTDYTLTVRYSGPSTKRVDIPRGGKQSFSVTSGSYRITASVNARNVQNYAGTESLSGGEYESTFYIVTSRY